MEFLESKKGGHMVLYNNFKYNRLIKKDNSTRWRCVTRTCDAKLYTDKKYAFTSAVGEHNHNEYDKSPNNKHSM
jgi:hypothetical protein